MSSLSAESSSTLILMAIRLKIITLLETFNYAGALLPMIAQDRGAFGLVMRVNASLTAPCTETGSPYSAPS